MLLGIVDSFLYDYNKTPFNKKFCHFPDRFVYNSKQPDYDGGNIMELTKELKEKLENAESKKEAKKILEEAGVELTDEEMDQVAGGQMWKVML